MNSSAAFQIELLKLVDGARLLRVVDPQTGTALERRLDPAQPIVRQKEAIERALRAALTGELERIN